MSLSRDAGSAAAADCPFGADRARTARHEAEQAVLDRRRDVQLAAEGGASVRHDDEDQPVRAGLITPPIPCPRADAGLVKDIQDQAGDLESAKAELDDRHRQAADAGKPQETAQAASRLAVALRAREAIAASGPAGGDADEQQEDTGETVNPAQAALAGVTAQMERELGQEGWPEGLMELRPGAPVHSDIRILFAVEPPATALLIAALEGPEVTESQFPEAVMASADMLRRVRAGQAPEAATHGYDNLRSFLEELYPGNVGDASIMSATSRD